MPFVDAQDWCRRWSPGIGPTKGGDVAEMYAENFERWDVALGSRIADRDGLVAFADGFINAVPDAVAALRVVTQTETACVIEWHWTGTHTGDAPGWPARGEPIDCHGVNVIQLDGGLITHETSYWDAKTMFGG